MNRYTYCIIGLAAKVGTDLPRTILATALLVLLVAGIGVAQSQTSFVRQDLASSVLVPSDTTVAVIAQEVTMPADGGPWRLIGFYDVQLVGNGAPGTTSNCNCEVWLDDQQPTQNVFADTAVGFPTNFGTPGFPGSGVSLNSYGNGQTVVLLLQVRAGDGLGVTVLPSAFGTAKTHLDLLIVPGG